MLMCGDTSIFTCCQTSGLGSHVSWFGAQLNQCFGSCNTSHLCCVFQFLQAWSANVARRSQSHFAMHLVIDLNMPKHCQCNETDHAKCAEVRETIRISSVSNKIKDEPCIPPLPGPYPHSHVIAISTCFHHTLQVFPQGRKWHGFYYWKTQKLIRDLVILCSYQLNKVNISPHIDPWPWPSWEYHHWVSEFAIREWVVQKLPSNWSYAMYLYFCNSILFVVLKQEFTFLETVSFPFGHLLSNSPICQHDLEGSLSNRALGSSSWPSTLFALSFSKGLKDHYEGLPSDQFYQSQSCWPEPTHPEAAFHHITKTGWVLGEQEPELAKFSLATDFRLHQWLGWQGAIIRKHRQSCWTWWK